MAGHKSKAGFNAMSVAELKKISTRTGNFSERILENLVSENHLRSRENGSASGSKFRKGDTTASDELIIHGMLIPNPFFLKTVNNFNASQPFDSTTFLII